MTKTCRTLALSALIFSGVAPTALASPITWSFEGTIGSPLMPEIPAGTAVRVDWTFDPTTPNICSDPTGGGYYPGQSATVRIASTIGMLTYQAASGFLISNSWQTIACGANAMNQYMELRLYNWTGPDLPSAQLYPANLPYPPGLFWTDPTLGGAFPTSQPQNVFFMMQPFIVDGGGPFNSPYLALAGNLHAVPEPSTWLLLGTGLAAVVARRRFARRH